jgi:sortase A
MRRLIRILATMMIVAGLGMLAWAVTVWQWQDPFTAAVQELEQRKLAKTLEREVDLVARRPAKPAAASPAALRSELAGEARAWRRRSSEGDAIARLRIPSIGVDEVMVNGTATDTLKRGPGRYLGSAMPGEGELVYVAGHRTTYGAPFSRIDRLQKGDAVFVKLPYGTFEYTVTGSRIVPATKVSELESRGFEQLALQACHPRFFATERYIVYARPVRVTRPGDSEPLPLAGQIER